LLLPPSAPRDRSAVILAFSKYSPPLCTSGAPAVKVGGAAFFSVPSQGQALGALLRGARAAHRGRALHSANNMNVYGSEGMVSSQLIGSLSTNVAKGRKACEGTAARKCETRTR